MGGSQYEVHNGLVSDRKDPEKRGRLKVAFKTIFDGEWPEWVDPCFPFAGSNCGWFAVPPVGTAVECEVHRGKGPDVTIDTPRIRWRSALYNRVDQIPKEFQKNYPNVSGFKSPGGHILIMDDTEGKEFLFLGHGKKPRTSLCFDRYGGVSLRAHRAAGGSIGIDMDPKTGFITITAGSGILLQAAGRIHLRAPTVSINDRVISTIGNDPF